MNQIDTVHKHMGICLQVRASARAVCVGRASSDRASSTKNSNFQFFPHSLVSVRVTCVRRIGGCAQHDVLWPELTVREHLLFYARLKVLGLRARVCVCVCVCVCKYRALV